jgi:hypothetical protein
LRLKKKTFHFRRLACVVGQPLYLERRRKISGGAVFCDEFVPELSFDLTPWEVKMALLGSVDGRRSDSIADQSMSAEHVLVRVKVNLLKKNGPTWLFASPKNEKENDNMKMKTVVQKKTSSLWLFTKGQIKIFEF